MLNKFIDWWNKKHKKEPWIKKITLQEAIILKIYTEWLLKHYNITERKN